MRRGSVATVDMAVFCQMSKPVPPQRLREFSYEHALSVLFVLQVRLVGDTAF